MQADGKILVGGNFNGVGSPPRNYLARLNTDGTLDGTFFSFANDLVYTIALQTDGKILVGGQFASIGGAPRNYVARLNANGSADSAFDPNANNWVYGISVQSDGKIVLGGEFTAIGPLGGQPRNHIARLLNNTPALQDLSVTQTAVTWTRSGGAPELTRATFELSTDGTTYSFLGNGVRVGVTSNFTLTGQNLPTGQNIYIRARGFYRGGYQTGSESVTESVLNAFLFDANANTEPYTTPESHANAKPDANTKPHASAHPHAESHTTAESHAHANTNTNSYRDTGQRNLGYHRQRPTSHAMITHRPCCLTAR